jgi:hypothetical protein
MTRLFLCGLVSFMTVQISTQAAVTLVSNIDNPFGEEDVFYQGSSLYQAFQTGSSAATIQGIELKFGYVGNASGIGISIYSDVNGQAGSSLASFAPVDVDRFNTFTGGQTFDFSGSLNVNANTNYWVVLSATGGTDMDGNTPGGSMNYVSITNDGSDVGLAGWTLGNSHYFGSPASPVEYSGNPIQMTISGSVPEPSSLSLLVLGIGSLALLRRRI